ncbi:MAG: hypothetical protein N2689_09335 [Verrucomicrobiae bacterium]|nr:hypothetical protein [Verrucomicrobiae bacterium]
MRVGLREEAGRVLLEISDDGKGIMPDQVGGAKSLGLLGMKERAAAVGGSLEIAGAPGKGTRVVMKVMSEG